MKATLILAVVTAYTVVSECSKAPDPKGAADRLYAGSHVVAVDNARPTTASREIDPYYAKRDRGHDVRE
jgi:hypothetical protein